MHKRTIRHTVPGFPEDVYSIGEHTSAMKHCFIPKVNGQALMSSDKGRTYVATFPTLDDAIAAVREFLSRMQGN